MESIIETIENNGFVAKIGYDSDFYDNPREWDNLTTVYTAHRRYRFEKELGRNFDNIFEALASEILSESLEDIFETSRDFEHYMERLHKKVETKFVVFPLYLYDHGGISVSLGSFSCPWDSGQVGFVVIDKLQFLKVFSKKRWTKKMAEKAESVANGEIETLDQYLRGEVYCYIVENSEGDHVDSLYGLYGFDHCKAEAKNSLNYELQKIENEKIEHYAALLESAR